MNAHAEHITPENFFKKVEIPFTGSKEEVWEKLSEKISGSHTVQSEPKVRSFSWYKMAAASVILLLVGATLFLKFYTTTIQTEKGEHASFVLPDGSIVELNAASSLTYHPYWWRFERKVKFEGEAFFEIGKGKDFTVASTNGETKVLGTSFNIFTWNNNYKVFCKTGLVKVSSTISNVEFIIRPGEMAVIDNYNKLGRIESKNADKILGWKENKFNFTSEQLIHVFKELERQYNVKIIFEVKSPEEYIYTGYFTKSTSISTTLDLICKSFDFTFVKLRENSFKVLQNNK